MQLLLASVYSGAFHPSAEGQAAIADAVVEKARASARQVRDPRPRRQTRQPRLRRLGRSLRQGPSYASIPGDRIAIRYMAYKSVLTVCRMPIFLTPVHRLPMYNCKKCPGYCCSYPLIALDKRDVERLAKHFGLTFRQAKAKFTVERWGRKYSMRRKTDKILRPHLPLLRHREALLHRLRGAPLSLPQLSRRALRLLRLPQLRAAHPGRPRGHRHHQQQVTSQLPFPLSPFFTGRGSG